MYYHSSDCTWGKSSKRRNSCSNNLKITENVLKVFGEKIKHFILSSILTGKIKKNVISESSILRPSSMYGLSKNYVNN